MRAAVLLSCLLLLAGCANLQRLKEQNPNPDDFSGALASEYLAYADSELEQGHLFSSEHFAGKGLHALHGQPVEPDVPDSSLPPELSEARGRLMGVLDEDIKRVAPQKLARAQLLYDCWQHQRGASVEKAPCADEFGAALTEVEAIADSFRYREVLTRKFSFAKGSAHLGAGDDASVSAVAHMAKHSHGYIIEIEAHEGVGSAEHELSLKRLAVLRAALIKHGVNEAKIRMARIDDSRKVVLSADASPENPGVVHVTVKVPRAAKEGTS